MYYTGSFLGYNFNKTYIGSTGLDISVASMSTLLDELEGTLTANCFAFIASAAAADELGVLVMSQSTVEKLYPPRTGMEEARIIYSAADGSIKVDRRNQTYQVSDTIFQPPTKLNNADWKGLAEQIKALERGERDTSMLNITLTGDETPTSFHVMYERWPDVADWVTLLFVPTEELDHSIQTETEIILPDKNETTGAVGQSISYDGKDVHLHIPVGETMQMGLVVHNKGTLDISVALTKVPTWMTMTELVEETQSSDDSNTEREHEDHICIHAGESLTFQFLVSTDDVRSTSADGVIAITVEDDKYRNCFYEGK